MAQKILISARGQDRPGILHKFTSTVTTFSGNIESHRQIVLGEEFSLLMIAVFEEYTESTSKALKEAGDDGWDIRIKTLDENKTSTGPIYKISMQGADHKGILDEIASYITHQKGSITKMEADVNCAPMTGICLFEVGGEIQFPHQIDLTEFEKELKNRADKLNVDIHLTRGDKK